MNLTPTDFVKQAALEIGFDACGIARVDYLAADAGFMKGWLEKGFHAEMTYLERNFEKRTNPGLLVDGCKSVIVVLMNYFPEKKQPENTPKIAKYAFSQTDYHEVIKHKLLLLENSIIDNLGADYFNTAQQHRFVDSAPVLERQWAARSGLGWIGKNKLLINPDLGSFYFIGVLLVNKEMDYNEPVKNRCGTCRKCLDSCPAKALTENDGLDANRCISYQTIEKKGEVSGEMQHELSGFVFGCDICQDVCPWNQKKSTSHQHSGLAPIDELLSWDKTDWENLSEEQFNKVFKNSALKRAGYRKLKQNLHYFQPVKGDHSVE